MIVDSLHLKRIQTNQREELTEIRKSNMEIQCVKPQIRDHPNKVLASKGFNRSTGLSMSSNVQALCSFQINHIRHALKLLFSVMLLSFYKIFTNH